MNYALKQQIKSLKVQIELTRQEIANAKPCSLHKRDLRKHLDKLYKQLAGLNRRKENGYTLRNEN